MSFFRFPMFKSYPVISLLLVTNLAFAQSKFPAANTIKRPNLVVGIVIDQMRWDYLYRYYNRYSDDGFKRLLKDGFRCENNYINYLPSSTAVGHSAIFSGTTPAINGIAGNDWIEQLTGKTVYCVSDSTVKGVGSNTKEGQMSPRNLLSTTITDELRLATNFRSKVVGVSLKDRASILPAGHNPTGAFWFDDANGSFITSTYYMSDLPAWVKAFNAKKEPEALLANGWSTLYPLNTYVQSGADDSPWEGKFSGEASPVFPHTLSKFYKTRKGVMRQCPFGNTLTLDFARAAIDAYKLGKGEVTDFLTINCASTDYVGHMYGPNSIEIEDTYLRLDRDLAAFFKELDEKVGKGKYTVFLTADHGASHSVEFSKAHNMPGGYWKQAEYRDKLNSLLKEKYHEDKLVLAVGDYKVNFNRPKISAAKLDFEAIKKTCVDFLQDDPNTLFVVDMAHLDAAAIPDVIRTKIINGYNYRRSALVLVIPKSGFFESGPTGTGHGEWNPYDTHISLIFMGWGIKPGVTYGNTYTVDIAPTIASLLKIQAPSGSIGSPISAVLNSADSLPVTPARSVKVKK
jgi:hypothetical protein